MRIRLTPRSLCLPVAMLAGSWLLPPPPLAAQAVLRPGTEARGELKGGDTRLDDNTYVDLWRFNGSAGQQVRITMRSSAFDAYLALGYPDDSGEWHPVESDDDGAGGTDARVSATLPRDGEYVVRANTLSEGQTGSYTLLLESGVEAAPAPRAASGRAAAIALGTPVSGELRTGDEVLDDDSFADTYAFQGRSGQQLEITLRSSDFDAYLAFGRPRDGGFSQLESDDDGAGGTDSKLSVTLGEDGAYLVRANTLFKNKTGRYTLRVDVAGGAGVAGGPTPAPAGGGNPLVSSAPGARMPVVLGQELSGRLGPGDDTISDGSHADIWVYQGRRDETLTMVQRSGEIDSYLTFGPVVDGSWTWEKSDNDGAGGDDARLVVTLPRDGEYWIRPNALFAGSGSYTLMVTSDRAGAPAAAAPAPSPPGPPPARCSRGSISRRRSRGSPPPHRGCARSRRARRPAAS